MIARQATVRFGVDVQSKNFFFLFVQVPRIVDPL